MEMYKYLDENKFQLIETMLWQDGEFYLLDLHLKRLEESAKYFQFSYDKDQLIHALELESKAFQSKEKYRVRLLLHKDGVFAISSAKIDDGKKSKGKRVIFSPVRTDSDNIFLYHKTTNRELYNREFQRVRSLGYYDVLFLNCKGEVTEGAISNIIIKACPRAKRRNRDKFYTPPIRCGLLDGVYRRHLFDREDFPLEEKVLFEQDILNAEKLYLTNSVRGMVEVGISQRNGVRLGALPPQVSNLCYTPHKKCR